MELAAIIAEYDPFHNGHQYQIQQARAMGASHVVVVMGGNFLQRGTPAMVEKHLRAKMAVLGGADLVLELPLAYSCATAERFAYGGVALADALGCVDWLCFGSESGELTQLIQLAQLLEEPSFSDAVKRQLADGSTFAAARQRAVEKLAGPEQAALLEEPNNILGVEYLRQIYRQKLPLEAKTVRRRGAAHHGNSPLEGIASATQIRAHWQQGEGVAEWVPTSTADLLQNAPKMDWMRWEAAQLAFLRRLSVEELARLPDVSEGIENRLYTAIRAGRTMEEVLMGAKTKRYTLARIRRMLLAAYLELEMDASFTPPPYLRVLACGVQGTEVLAAAKQMAKLPLSTSLAKLERLGGEAEQFAKREGLSTDLYTASLRSPLPCGSDYTVPVFYQ